ncbi:DUF1365 domain-containing protein [Pectobacterium brasiliense]|uniref:DUF1365 domain-containing protein n=1 Tax=Pectobacterium brasiliense TaxID=180957 RepID=UPI00057DDAF0|nr:DUF1365 domain-containing protein [Pectobacterium brasiliense]KHT43529.1 plasmid partition ParA protein [Pectobacterium brasiliense]
MNSALYVGKVRHRRFTPVTHRFDYALFMTLIDLDEIPALPHAGIALERFSPASFCRGDYLGGGDIKTKAQDRIAELTGERLTGKVLLLCQLRYLGCYFNPVNFYYLYDEHNELRWLLAEVRNTPWNERHTYAVVPDGSTPVSKAFHVSPFNPMEMVYHWQLTPPDARLRIHIENHRQGREFDATLVLHRQPLTRAALRAQLWSLPLMTMKTACTIYWQALKLWIKRSPVYPHPQSEKKDNP